MGEEYLLQENILIDGEPFELFVNYKGRHRFGYNELELDIYWCQLKSIKNEFTLESYYYVKSIIAKKAEIEFDDYDIQTMEENVLLSDYKLPFLYGLRKCISKLKNYITEAKQKRYFRFDPGKENRINEFTIGPEQYTDSGSGVNIRGVIQIIIENTQLFIENFPSFSGISIYLSTDFSIKEIEAAFRIMKSKKILSNNVNFENGITERDIDLSITGNYRYQIKEVKLKDGDVRNFCFLSIDIKEHSKFHQKYGNTEIQNTLIEFHDFVKNNCKSQKGFEINWAGDGGGHRKEDSPPTVRDRGLFRPGDKADKSGEAVSGAGGGGYSAHRLRGDNERRGRAGIHHRRGDRGAGGQRDLQKSEYGGGSC